MFCYVVWWFTSLVCMYDWEVETWLWWMVIIIIIIVVLDTNINMNSIDSIITIITIPGTAYILNLSCQGLVIFRIYMCRGCVRFFSSVLQHLDLLWYWYIVHYPLYLSYNIMTVHWIWYQIIGWVIVYYLAIIQFILMRLCIWYRNLLKWN